MTRQHMDQMCRYDVQQINSRYAHRNVLANVLPDTEEDWSHNNVFPWWVWLAATGSSHESVGGGIFSFTVTVAGGKVQIGFRSTECDYVINHNGKYKKEAVVKSD